MNNQNAEEYLLSIPKWTKQKNSFEDIRTILNKLVGEDPNVSILHVAGTNGKGSVCAFLTSMLVEGGYVTGTFTSPHLTDIRERFLINGQMVSKELFDKSFAAVFDAVEEASDSSYGHPTFFEFLFLMGMVIFKECRVDYIVMEAGLGGRLDTTNVIKNPLATVITSVSMDHMEYLGDTLILIASEKAGIIKSHRPVIYDNNTKEVSAVIEQRANELSSALFPVDESQFIVTRRGDGFLRVTTPSADREGGGLTTPSADCKGGGLTTPSFNSVEYHIPFVGRYQAMNAMLAVKTIRAAGISLSEQQMQAGIRKTVWPGRMEQVLPGIYLDGAHNVGGIQAFIETAKELSHGRKSYLMFAVVSDKDYETMIERLCRELSLKEVVTAQISGSRGLDRKTLEGLFSQYAECPVTGFFAVKEAVEYILKLKQREEPIFCVGSLYLVGEIKSELRRRYHD